ncbi:hypothetical protein L228DRAFT_268791 [Xylona heveae TC161]|uniref:Sterol regulatory element-binding protein cleavage-activating protein n=1 Tax=Xylona heveae (strain CBS 132557 / TC161) TaxID=1328760 RepID=A0A165GKV9_XYLHT|nr:hypothetical protein L228DRAFT_268791 [Xylona heveae TC161]KZF22316.1 hypothetical protein L228DRAFT_268791 [Xylona heveae TC161]
MGALEPHVLQEALALQDALIADPANLDAEDEEDGLSPLLHAKPRANSNASIRSRGQSLASRRSNDFDSRDWFFHSPLLYWNCSSAEIAADPDILRTINSRANFTSANDFTLRHSTVFAGKSFKGDRLVAADALVISLLSKIKSSVTEDWIGRAQRLVNAAPGRWSLYSSDPLVARPWLYEFRFQPMSLHDDFLLALAYLFMAAYVGVSLSKMRAVKSRFGLVVTVIVQIATSIMASFTICTMCRINLTGIPHEAYPFVVLAIGLENMFRVINAVLAIPGEMPTTTRLATALGDIGHLSLASAGQNLLILGILSKVVSPGVAAFCAFAAVALVFDFIFHLTFFVAVLSVDVRRMELQESLERVNVEKTDAAKSDAKRQTWNEALYKGELPFSTRIAGSAILIAFVVALNGHFFENETPVQVTTRLYRLLKSSGTERTDPTPASLEPVNQARTPTAWMRLQDHDTAKELIDIVKPHAHRIIARVHDPLVFVLSGADRKGGHTVTPRFSELFHRLLEEHLLSFVLALIITLAAVSLLMNYLLWNEIQDGPSDTEERLLRVKTLPAAHDLDVAQVVASSRGVLVSIALDRSVCVWSPKSGSDVFENRILRADAVGRPLWPVSACAIDDAAQLVAICSASGHIYVWSVAEHHFTKSLTIDLAEQQPCAFFFARIRTGDSLGLRLILIRPDGCMIESDMETDEVDQLQICRNPLVCARVIDNPKAQINIITVSRSGCMHIVSRDFNHWVSEGLELSKPRQLPSGKIIKVKSVVPVPALGMVLAVKLCEIDVIDLHYRTVIRSLQTGQVKGQSLRVIHSPRRPCLACGASSIGSFSIVYTEAETHDCMMHTFTSGRPGVPLCLTSRSTGRGPSCCGIEYAEESLHWVENSSAWEATGVNNVVGIRQVPEIDDSGSSSSSDSGSSSCDLSDCTGIGAGILRKRKTTMTKTSGSSTPTHLSSSTSHHRHPHHPHSSPSTPRPQRRRRSSPFGGTTASTASSSSSDESGWEAWMLSASGEVRTSPLILDNDVPGATASLSSSNRPFYSSLHLLVSKAGPITQLGKRSVVVGFGNVLKLLMVGNERFTEANDPYDDIAFASVGYRRRLVGRKAL